MSACNAGDPASTLGQEDPLEKEMAPHTSTLTWEIPWTEERGRLQSMVIFWLLLFQSIFKYYTQVCVYLYNALIILNILF